MLVSPEMLKKATNIGGNASVWEHGAHDESSRKHLMLFLLNLHLFVVSTLCFIQAYYDLIDYSYFKIAATMNALLDILHIGKAVI